ncbi:MAG: outer membrane lipoprotein-sorting protein [Acidobacteriota bacterium]|nr:outer membrane lipoprotein-sorting protein [Acidobacteriota bacterium]
MKGLLKLTAALLLTLTCVAGTAGELEDILKGNYEARGGLDKIRGTNTQQIKGKIVAQGGAMELAFSGSVKRPDKLLMKVVFQGMDIQSGINGDDAWMINPMMGSTDPQDMPEMQKKMMVQQMDLDGPLVDYEKDGAKVEFMGKEDVEGTECFKLKHTDKEGKETTYYLDTESYIEIKTVSETMDPMGNPYVAHTFFSDYQEVDGLMIAHTVTVKNDQGIVVNEVVLEELKINVEMDDAIFARPKPAPKPEEGKPDQ